jgi:ribA/ribD-fused uncharacterized protein
MRDADINSFKGDHDFLSNFYPSPVRLGDITYPTVEHAFQAAKTLDVEMRERIAALETPGRAKRAGRKVELRGDWEDIKVQVMHRLVERKFQDPELARMLIGTGDAQLVEGNWWHDHFWGVCDGHGQNWLGRILMDVRSRLQPPS